jgi:RNA polymerase sigma factor (sigma-70 family)
MTTTTLTSFIQHLRRSALPLDLAARTDGELLAEYAARRDQAAFAALVHRHGAMVWGVCRRILRNEADAEDAFQATFLVLVRKAAVIRAQALVGNWLYGVAHNTALKARALARRRQEKERAAALTERALSRGQAGEEVWRQTQALLDEALSRLADKQRAAIVLCDLEGKTIRKRLVSSAVRRGRWPATWRVAGRSWQGG